MGREKKQAKTLSDGYLDIETTGLSWLYADITIIGIYMVNGINSKAVEAQLGITLQLKGIGGLEAVMLW